jgi:hypothetical protein
MLDQVLAIGSERLTEVVEDLHRSLIAGKITATVAPIGGWPRSWADASSGSLQATGSRRVLALRIAATRPGHPRPVSRSPRSRVASRTRTSRAAL